MSKPQATGADLARIALRAAQKAAQQRSERGITQRKPKRRSTHRQDGRDPMELGGALTQLITERGWQRPAADGSIMSRGKDIAPADFATHLQPVAFNKNTRQLELLPDSHALALRAKLITPQLMEKANPQAGSDAVRATKILPVGARPRGSTRWEPTQSPPVRAAAPTGPIRTRKDASPGYHRGHRRHRNRPPRPGPRRHRLSLDPPRQRRTQTSSAASPASPTARAASPPPRRLRYLPATPLEARTLYLGP